jgi:hypothetical protein
MTPRPLYPRERTPLTVEQETGWALLPVWTFQREENSLSCTGIRTPDRFTTYNWVLKKQTDKLNAGTCEISPSLEANSSSPSQDVPRILWNL